jgi:hypothetical protein
MDDEIRHRQMGDISGIPDITRQGIVTAGKRSRHDRPAIHAEFPADRLTQVTMTDEEQFHKIKVSPAKKTRRRRTQGKYPA